MSSVIGAKLRQLRQSKKWTQEEVSAKLDYKISRSTLSNYEIGRRTPHLKDLQKLASIYGVGLDYFDISVKEMKEIMVDSIHKYVINGNMVQLFEKMGERFVALGPAERWSDELINEIIGQ